MLIAVAVAGCDFRMVDDQMRDLSTYYEEGRKTPENGQLISLEGSYTQAFNTAVRNLRAQDFQIVEADVSAGRIVARSNKTNLVSCGALQSGPLGSVAIYAANAPVSIIEVPGARGGSTFVRREFSSMSDVTILIRADATQGGAIFATIAEQHSATIRTVQLNDNAVIYNETLTFDGASRAKFSRGVICGSARATRAIIRQS